MKPFVIILMLAVSVPSVVQKATRETNSHAAAKRGVEQYNRGQYEPAVKSFGEAATIEPAPRNSFNLGTAQIAAGKRTEGANTLANAMNDPSLRAETLYNRGNGALESKAYELAVRDYTEALKMNPRDVQAKRNLEIAIQEKQSMQKARGSQPQQQQSPQKQPQQQPEPSPSDQNKDQKKQDADTEALLRSVQQQEQEELARMKKARGEAARIGW